MFTVSFFQMVLARSEYGPPTNGLGLHALLAQARSEHPDTRMRFVDPTCCLVARAGWPKLDVPSMSRVLGPDVLDAMIEAHTVGDFLALYRTQLA